MGLLLGGASVIWMARASRRRKLRDGLAGKVIVITGGSRGLGLALSEACLEAGGKVAMLARDLEELESGRAKLLGLGYPRTSIEIFQCDMTDEQRVKQTMNAVVSTLGPVDIWINNAGTIVVGPVENQASRSFQEAMAINFFGALHGINAVLPEMLRRGTGQIVNIASIGGLIAVPHLLPYSASKFALVGLSRGLTAELASKGIQVLTVCPWLMRTGSHVQAFFSGQRSKEYRWFSLGATLPVISVDAHAAATRIVVGIQNKDRELLISAWSGLAYWIARLAPGTLTRTLSVVNQLALPGSVEHRDSPSKGFEVREREWKLLNRIGTRLAAEWNQKP